MKTKNIILIICSLFLLLTGCNSSVNKFDYEKYEQMARDALVENIETTSNDEAIDNLPFGDVIEPEFLNPYIYVWSNEPENDIKWLRTLKDKEKQLIYVQFYATDDEKVWVGDVIIHENSNEIVEVSGEHIFTSGVLPIMVLSNIWHNRNHDLENDFGRYKVLKTADSIDSEFCS